MIKNIKKYKFKKISLVLIILGVVSFTIKAFTQTTVGADGILHEPFFFLIPIGYLLIFLGLVGLIINKLVISKERN